MALEIAAGLLYLHSKSLLHLDLKSPNVLLDDQNRAHVADIGLAQMMIADEGGTVSYAVSFMWAAPEQLQVNRKNNNCSCFVPGGLLALWHTFWTLQANRLVCDVS